MSKKRFSAGLDDLFSDAYATAMTGQSAVEKAAPAGRRSVVHKNFLSGLDALLQEALDESLEKYTSDTAGSASSSGKSKSQPQPRVEGGLDALIRQTMNIQELSADEVTGKRRLTVSVDRTKLEQLKAIAKLENAYLKDLLIGVLDEYIKSYTQDKGLSL